MRGYVKINLPYQHFLVYKVTQRQPVIHFCKEVRHIGSICNTMLRSIHISKGKLWSQTHRKNYSLKVDNRLVQKDILTSLLLRIHTFDSCKHFHGYLWKKRILTNLMLKLIDRTMSLNPLHPNISVQILYTVHDRSWYISYITYKENLFNNQELLIFITLMFDSRVILLEEISCLSLFGVKGKMVNATEWKRYQLLLIKNNTPSFWSVLLPTTCNIPP